MNKKNLIIYIIIFVLGIGCTFIVTRSIYKGPKAKTTNIDRTKLVEGGKTGELKEYAGEIPDFAMPIRGSYTGIFTDEELKSSGIKVYEFQGSLKFFFGDVESTYVGIKFKDFLDHYNITKYEKVTFSDYNRLSVQYLKEEVDDNAFLILKRNNKTMIDKFIGFIDFSYSYNYSVEGVLELTFN